MKRQYNVVIEQDEDGYYVGIVPELPGCHSQAKSLDELRKRIKEAIELYLEVEKGAPRELNFIGIQKIEVQA
jgi:predicted RNase H-like HicB family nuclease